MKASEAMISGMRGGRLSKSSAVALINRPLRFPEASPPRNTAKSVAAQIVNGGTVAHAYLGVQVGDAANGAGASIASVQSDSPAADAGLQSGDVVTAVNGKSITDASDLTTAIASACGMTSATWWCPANRGNRNSRPVCCSSATVIFPVN